MERSNILLEVGASFANSKVEAAKGLFTRKSNLALGLQVNNRNNIFLYMKRNYLIAR
jgi:hypothetical protein